MQTIGYAVPAAGAPLVPYHFERRALRANDVAIDILFCGICHSDLHSARIDFGPGSYPSVLGHEIVGRVSAVGAQVTGFAPGQKVAIGCMVDSCLACDQCEDHQEQYCRHGFTSTYNAPDRITGERTYGGFSKHIVVRQEFVLRVPETLDISRVGPLLCAGITSYAPLRQAKIGPGSRVGVIGLGGLGHMAVKLAAAMGAEVTVLSRSADKLADARALGASALLPSADPEAMRQAAGSLDLIIDTVPTGHDVNPYLPLLDVGGTLVIVGQFGPFSQAPSSLPLLFGRRAIAGSLIGGIAETQELLDLCAAKQIYPECEMIRMDEINQAFERLDRADVRYRFVIDMSSLAA